MGLTKKIPLILVLSAITIAVVLFFLPRTPQLSEELKESSPSDLKVQQAVEMVEQTGAPMKGIMLLREVLQEDPKHKDALWYLGMFSMQSGQYDKAVERFEELVNAIGDKQDKANIGPLSELARAYMALGENEKAIETLSDLENLIEDETLKQDINKRKEELLNALKN